jgi:hypothetical protein
MVGSPKNLHYILCQDKRAYIDVQDFNYDFVLVDGKHRQECMEKIKSFKNWSTLMLHDAERKEYKPAMDLFKDYQQEMLINLWICKNK